MEVMEREEMEVSGEREDSSPAVVSVPKDMRDSHRYTGCECEWNASLPYMRAREVSEDFHIYVNGTGEIPCVLTNDVLYRVKRKEDNRVLSEEEMKRIADTVRSWDYITIPEDVLLSLSRDIPEEGSFVKRFRSELYRATKMKPSEHALSSVGNLVKGIEEAKTSEFVFSLSREFDRHAGFYVNDGSCYWGSDVYRRSMCHVKHVGAFLILKHSLEEEASSLEEIWDRDREEVYGGKIRSLVIPVKYAKGEYLISPAWEKERLSRFVVMNSYWTQRNGMSCVDSHMASLLATALAGGEAGKNVRGTDCSDYFYMNGFTSRPSIPIVHVGRGVPKRTYPMLPYVKGPRGGMVRDFFCNS